MKSTKPLTDSSQAHHLYYEPTSVLDSRATSSPAGAAAAVSAAHHNPHVNHHHQHHQQQHHIIPPQPPSSDEWDSLSWLLSPDKDSSSADILSLPAAAAAAAAAEAPSSHPFFLLDSCDLPSCPSAVPVDSCEALLMAAADSLESGDFVSADGILSRLNQHLPSPSGTPLYRVAFYFKEALFCLLASPDRFLVPTEPPLPPAELVRHIGAQRAFACLSPIPQFASFTANQTLLEAFETAATTSFHVIDFDLGLGGQWSSFIEEIAARSRSLHHSPAIRITAVVHEETAETLLAAENLRDFARGLGVRFAIDVVCLGGLHNTHALASVRLAASVPAAIVLSPAVFGLLAGSGPGATDDLLRFVRRTAPQVIVFVDTEASAGSGGGMGSFPRSVESCTVVMESVETAAATVGAGEEAVRRVERGVVRPRVLAAVRSWWARCEPWKEVVGRAGWAPVGLSDFAVAQAEWIVRRAPMEGFHVARRERALVLTWHGHELASTSAWRC